jgi:hypothetical protein
MQRPGAVGVVARPAALHAASVALIRARAGAYKREMRLVTLLAFALLALAGCGGGGDGGRTADRSSTPTPRPDDRDPQSVPRETAPTGPVTGAEKAIIRGWADALRAGDVERASSYWRPPAIAANGSQPFRLVTMRAVRHFNAGLTCGARLESTERDKAYVVATFRLTNRRGRPGACGSGVGQQARTLFLLRDGKIVQWIRAADPPGEGALPGGSPS